MVDPDAGTALSSGGAAGASDEVAAGAGAIISGPLLPQPDNSSTAASASVDRRFMAKV